MKRILLFAVFLMVQLGFGQSPQTFDTSGTFVVPAGVTALTVQAWGAGGGGGGSTTAGFLTARGGAGGGGGAYATALLTVTPGVNLLVVVGNGGTGNAGANGTSGGFSTITGFTSSIYAAGGSFGTANTSGGTPLGGAGGTVAASVGSPIAGLSGINGQTGLFISSGDGGQGANSGGAGGTALDSGTGNGNVGTQPGGGGGGARTSQYGGNQTGGAGGSGRVIISWSCPTYSLTGGNSATAACASVGTSTVTLVSTAVGLPIGTYTVTYNRSAPAQTGLTATMTVSTAGTGTFTATGLTTAGSSTVTVTRLVSGAVGSLCSSNITSGNTATVVVNGLPTTANAGPDQTGATTCGSTSVTLAGNAPSVGTGTWSIISGTGGTVTTPSSATSTFSGTAGSTYTLRWTIANSPCTSSTDDVVITFNISPSAPTVGTITDVTCSSTTGSVVLSDLPSGSWTINQSNGTTNTTYSGSGASYTVTGLAVGSYTFSVNNVTCTSASTPNVPIIDASSATWNGSGWDGGIAPDATKNIIIDSSLGSPFAANLSGCSLTINTGVTATVPSGVTLTITNAVTTNGQLIFENNASLVQTTNATNTGAIEYRRISKPMKNFDYTYWSSPVWGDGTIVPKQTAKNLSPNTLADKYFRFNGNVAVNDWVFDDGEMTPGVGFIIRTPKPGIYGAPYPETVVMPYSQPVAFKGVPNNGNYSFTVGENELNLIGNPYPSDIRADDFINANTSIIYGALYFWTHNTAIAPSGSDYVYTANDYASYTLAGGTGTSKAPSTGVSGAIPNGFIAAGQSFFVENAAPGIFQFTNAMRVAGNNSQFFKQANTKKTATIEKNRVWLNLTNSGGAFKQLLVGYITGATNDWDNLYDGPTFDGQEFVDFYSVNQGKNLTIQGRALPFVDTDVVPLGYRSTIAGSFDISIDNRDGALAGQAIWLEDKKTNTLHELSKGKYTFTAINGVENDRFVLKYTGKTLGTDDNEVADKSLIVSVKNKKITLTSSAEAITQVQLFDLLGRKVYDKSKINAQEWSISNLPSSEQTLIVKTTLANGAISNKKIIY